MKKAELVERVRHLLADTEAKLNGEAHRDFQMDGVPEEPDRQLLLEDLMARLASLCQEVDQKSYLGGIPETGAAYPLIERVFFGALTIEELEGR